MLGFAVKSRWLAFFNTESEFGCNDHFVAYGLQRFADPCFTCIRPIDLSRIKERAAFVVGAANERNHVLLFELSAVVADHWETPQTDGGDFQR